MVFVWLYKTITFSFFGNVKNSSSEIWNLVAKKTRSFQELNISFSEICIWIQWVRLLGYYVFGFYIIPIQLWVYSKNCPLLYSYYRKVGTWWELSTLGWTAWYPTPSAKTMNPWQVTALVLPTNLPSAHSLAAMLEGGRGQPLCQSPPTALFSPAFLATAVCPC